MSFVISADGFVDNGSGQLSKKNDDGTTTFLNKDGSTTVTVWDPMGGKLDHSNSYVKDGVRHKDDYYSGEWVEVQQSGGIDGNGTESLAAVAMVLVIAPEPISTGTGLLILGGIAVVGTVTIYADEIADGLAGAYDWMKGGKQRQRDRDYGLPPALIDWWHNGGGKAGHGGQDIGSEYGPAPGEILQEWEDLGRPGGSKPKGRRYPR